MSEYEILLEGGSPWGIRLQGGADFNAPMRIAAVTPGSKAEHKGLIAGVYLVEINGNKTEYLSMSQAQTLIKVTGNELSLRLKDGSSPPSSLSKSPMSPITPMSPMTPMSPITPSSPSTTRCVVMEGGRPWGIRLQGGRDSGNRLRIAQVTPESKAENAGLILGQQIMSINDVNTEQLSMIEAQDIIKQTGDILKLSIIEEQRMPSQNGRTLLSSTTSSSTLSESEERDKKAPFYDELKASMGEPRQLGGRTEAKGNTFKSMQAHTDAGLGKNVLTVFDMPAGERNKSIPILAPKVNKDTTATSDNSNADNGREFTIVGGKPWGIRLQGGMDFASPLRIAQVTPSSKADQVGLKVGDIVVSINDFDTTQLTLIESQDVIKETGDKLKLRIKSLHDVTEGALKSPDHKHVDDEFFEDLRRTMQGCAVDRSGRSVKGNAFKRLQSLVDSGAISP